MPPGYKVSESTWGEGGHLAEGVFALVVVIKPSQASDFLEEVASPGSVPDCHHPRVQSCNGLKKVRKGGLRPPRKWGLLSVRPNQYRRL
jgi:hypothetical protein